MPHTRIVVAEPTHAAMQVADDISDVIATANRERRPAKLAIATGRSPLVLYDELAQRVAERRLSFMNVVAFPLDEFVGIDPDHPSSLHSYLKNRLFRRLDVQNGALQ